MSPDALQVARENAATLGLGRRVDLRLGDAYAPVAPHERFDLIVSNPPYVAAAEAPALAREVRDFEPHGALVSGDGLDLLRRLIAGAPAILKSGGWLALEIGATQAEPVRGGLLAAGLRDVGILRDLAGRDRIALARRPAAEARVRPERRLEGAPCLDGPGGVRPRGDTTGKDCHGFE